MACARSVIHPSPGIAGSLAAALLLVAGCALTAPAPAQLPDGVGAGSAEETGGLAELDLRAREALERSEREPEDAEAALDAAVLLFQAADLLLQQGTLAALDDLPAPAVEAVLSADGRVADEVREAILSRCTAGLAAAERAAALRPGDVAVELHRALHLSLIAWANGPARALLAGYGPRLVEAIDAAVASDPAFDHGAPLRLQGRFRGQAPWPLGDLELASASLQRACELAPLAVNHLFYGDVLWRVGEREAAGAQWQAASTAGGDESTRWSMPLLQELARRRLEALSR